MVAAVVRALVWVVLLLAGHASAQQAEWRVPGDPAELEAACRGIAGLEQLGRDGYLGIECGYQALLLGSKIPVAPAQHVPWATPYARGPIKLLIITTFGNAAAEVAQLTQLTRELQSEVRWLLVADAALTQAAADERYRTQYLVDQARSVLREHYDAIVITFGTVTPHHGVPRPHGYLSDEIYRAILDKVHAGTGLLLIGQNNAGFWVDDTPLRAALPATTDGGYATLTGASFEPAAQRSAFASLSLLDSVTLYDWKLRPDAQLLAQAHGRPVAMVREHGRGRVVLLGWDGTLGPQRAVHRRAHFEHDLAIALRALTFAARKEPLVTLTLAAPDTPLPAGERTELTVTSSAPARLDWALRDDEFRTWASGTSSVQSRHRLQLPAAAAGSYVLDLIARDGQGRSLGWASQRVRFRSPETLQVQTNKDVYHVGEQVEITARLAGELEDSTVSVEVRDAAERLLFRELRALPAQQLTTQYPIRDARVAPHVVTVTVQRAGRPLLRAEAHFYVPEFGWNDYENVLWPTQPQWQLNEKLRDQGGFTGVLQSGASEDWRGAARFGFRSARLNDALLEPAQVQTAPASAQVASDATLQVAIESARRHGALAWVFQDERHQGADPGAPDTEGLTRYRAYLQQHYGSLSELNETWHSQHSSWSAITPTLTAAITPNLAPWVDFRAYVADQAFLADRRHAQQVRAALGTGAPVGSDGFTSSSATVPYGALDYGRLIAEGAFDFYCPYEDDLLFSSLGAGRRTKFVGWKMTKAQYFGQPWRDALRGYSGSLRFFGPTFWSDFGWLQPAGEWTEQSTRELRHGTGKLLMESERVLSPVVMLYSYPSILTASAVKHWTGHGDLGVLSTVTHQSRLMLEQMLIGSGVAPAYRTDDQVAHGALRGARLLVIPWSLGVALSDETVNAITEFVQQGGTVLADLAPAICDEHGALRAQGGLDALFGVRRSELQYVQREHDYLATTRVPDPLVPEREWFIDEWYERTLLVAGGTATGEHVTDGAPAFITHRTGQGQTLLLNLLLHSLLPSVDRVEDNEYALMRRVLQAAGVTPIAQVESGAGVPGTHLELNRFRDATNEYVGFYAARSPDAAPGQVRARFDTPKQTYDLRRGSYLGELDRVALPLRAGQAALFARLDYKVLGLDLDLTGGQRGEPVTVKLTVRGSGPVGKHVVRVTVSDPNGKAHYFYSRNVVLPQGKGQLQFIPALDDQPGTWLIVARDVVSGATREARLQLR